MNCIQFHKAIKKRVTLTLCVHYPNLMNQGVTVIIWYNTSQLDHNTLPLGSYQNDEEIFEMLIITRCNSRVLLLARVIVVMSSTIWMILSLECFMSVGKWQLLMTLTDNSSLNSLWSCGQKLLLDRKG